MLNLSEDAAREILESIRWPNGPTCQLCNSQRVTLMQGKTTRPGLYNCKDCRKPFTVTKSTIFEGAHIPLSKWIAAVYLMCASKKGISSHQIHRMLGITYKSAWHMTHRIRLAMKEGPLSLLLGGVVEVDETYVGGKPKNMHAKKRNAIGRGRKDHKTAVVALVQRGGGVRAKVVPNVTSENLKQALSENVTKYARIMTDEFNAYRRATVDYQGHETVNHSAGEYVRGDAYTNTMESYFSLLKPGVMGSFHHVSKQHLERYCDEFSFRWSNRKLTDAERTVEALKMAPGKRLVYSGNQIK